jgi:hypothetical protein
MSKSSKAGHWQASALVVAALISTMGAVSSALIETGWFGKRTATVADAPAADVSFTKPAMPQAAFAGVIEPVREKFVSPVTPAARIQFNPEPRSPVAPAMYVSKPLVTPAPKPKNRDLIDWKAIPRFFESLK